MRELADRYGRIATDLRVSLTDRCNLRCSYCMPAEGLDWLPDETVLTDDEVGEIRDAVPEGVTPVYVVVDGLLRAPLALIARSVDSTGELVDAAPCASATLEYPIAISVDSDIVGAVFCLAERPADDTIYVSTKILDPSVRGTPVRLEPAE